MEGCVMIRTGKWMPVAGALLAGVVIGWTLNSREPVFAGGNTDRFEDFVIATGPVNQALSNNAAFLNAELDGVWMLDYKSGKLLASVLNRQTNRMIAWSEMDLVKEFDIAPRSNVHFMMATGNVIKGQSVLYLVETTTGKMGVYSMQANETPTAQNPNPNGSVQIRRWDTSNIRGTPTQPQAQQPPGNPGNAVQPAGFNQPR